MRYDLEEIIDYMKRREFVGLARYLSLPFLQRVFSGVNEAFDTGLYARATTQHDEFVGILERDEESTEALLRDLGAVDNPLAAWKDLSDTQHQEQASLAFRGEWDPESETFTNERDSEADYQLHAILFELDGDEGTTAIYAHWEWSWTTHPIAHYRGSPLREGDRHDGAVMLRTMLRDHGEPVYATAPSDTVSSGVSDA